MRPEAERSQQSHLFGSREIGLPIFGRVKKIALVLSSVEVKVILDLVRSKTGDLRPQRFLKFLLPIFIGFLVSIIGQSSMPPFANALYFGTGYNAVVAGNAAGGIPNGVNGCATDMVAVGVGLTVNGSSPGFGIYCRAIGADGELVAQDQSSAANTTAVGGGNFKVFCPAGKVVTGISFIIWSNVAIRCATPPSLSDNSALIWYSATTSTPASTNCSANGIVAGFFTRTGAWTDAIGAYCLPYSLNTLSYNVNGGSGTAPASQTQTAPAQLLTASSAYAGTRTGFRFNGWNTAANGLGTDYATGSSIRPIGATTLYAKWTSTITYNGNTNSSGAVPDPTVAVSSQTGAGLTNLAHNSGSLTKTGYYFAGWNTAANGSGTNYPASNPALITETPYMHFDATNFDDTTNAWTDGSGNSRSIPGTAVTNATTGSVRGNPTKVTNSAGANGSSKSFPAVQGTTADGIVIGNGALTNYTFCHVARYAGATRNRIFAGITGNWFSGFWNSRTGVAYHEGWITGESGTNDTNWKVQCDTGGSSSLLRSNGVARTTVTNNTTAMPANISINSQGSRTSPGETSDWEVAEFIIYDSILSTNKIQEIEERLNRKYLISTFTPSVHTYNYASTGDITLYAQWNSTISYNGNGNTGGAVPTPTIAKGTAANTTLANAGTMLRTGFTFTGWNTQADGLGTNYASGLTTYASTGNTTLFARWTATVTFDPNGASGSPATSSSNSTPKTSQVFTNSISSIPLADLPTVGTMSRPGFTFGGWNTAANGTGTNFTPTAPRAYMRFIASNFNDTTNAWPDTSGNNRNIPGTAVSGNTGNIRGNPTLVDATGNGSSANFKAVKGGTTDGIVFGNETLANYTFCHVARYAGATRNRIFAGITGNWFSGFWNSRTGVAYHEGWITGESGTNDTNWKVQCDTGGSSSLLRSNGVARTTVTNNTTAMPANISINSQGSRTSPGETSDWEVAEVVIYPQILNTFQLESIEDSLKTTYGITGFTTPSSPASAGTFTPTGNVTLFARWTANGYNITFDTSTVTSGTLPTQGFSAGTAFSLPANTFARTGFTFRNWNTSANGSGTTYTNQQSVTLFSDLSLYPQWNMVAPGVPTVSVAVGNAEVTVTPSAAAAFGTTVGATTSMLVTTFNSSGVALNPAKTCAVVSPATSCVITGLTNGTNYQFAATATNATATSASSTKINGTPIGVVVTYNATTNGGTSGTASATYNKPTALVLPAASKTGFTFSGWHTAATDGTLVGGTGGNLSPNLSASIVNRSLTSNVATLTTSAAHGFVVGMSVNIIQIDSTFNGIYTITSVPTSTTFTYARTASNVTAAAVSPAGKVTVSALTLYAQFVGNTYTISYNGNGNTGGTVPASSSYQVGGTAHTVQGSTNPPTKTGYTFAGWTLQGVTSGPPNYYPSGPQTSVLLSTVINGTWTLCYSDLYSQGINVTTMKANCTGTYIMFAAAEIGTVGNSTTVKSNTFKILAAGERSKVFQATTQNTTVLNNGTYWFHTSNVSLGFATTSTINQNHCFANPGPLTLCWHWDGGQIGGYSAGDTTIGNSNLWVRHVYQSSGAKTDWNVGDSYSENSNATFVAKWTANTNTISYNENTGVGAAPANGSYVTGAATPYTVAAKPVMLGKTGAEFVGWNTAADGSGTSYSAGASLTTTANVVLYAQWRNITYSYSFQLNGGTSSVPASGTISYNGQITLPSSPTREGFTFAGWNNGSTTSNAGATVNITANRIFVAQWTAQSFEISYNGNGHSSGGPITAGAYIAGGVPYAIVANTFTRNGHTFSGWNTAANGSGTSYVVGAGYSTAANLSLFAQWTPASFTITYNSTGSTGGSPAVSSESWTYNSITPLTLSGRGDLVKTGYTFEGWSTTANANSAITTASPTTNTTYYPVWSATQYPVAYAPGTNASGSVASPGNKTFGQTFTLDNGSTLTPPASDGNVSYSFGYWSDGTKTYKQGATYVMPAANVILTANWIAIYNVTYNPNGGVSSIGSSQKAADEVITIGVAATRIGYDFVKWEDQSSGLWSPGETTTVTSVRFIFNAQWSPKNNAISFNGNNNTGGSVPANGTYVTDAAAYVIPGNSGSLVRTGYTFIGWNTLANGTGTDYPAGVGATYSVAADLVLFAKWQANTYLITYNGNGATGGSAPDNGSYVTGSVNPLTVAANRSGADALSKTGFSFEGWYTTATGTGGTRYEAGTGTLTTTSDLTLYAKWTAASFAVTYVTGDGASTAPTQSNTIYGSVFSLPAAPTRTGFNFIGWETGTAPNATVYAPGTNFTMGSSAITFTAKWSSMSYVVVYLLNGGSGSTPTQADVSYGQNFTTAVAPTRNGFTFTGWNDGATSINASTDVTNVTANKTLTAQWSIAAPGIPGTPTAVPGDGNATITVTPPSSGGTPSSYTVTASPGGATCTLFAPATSCTISPLTNGTAYTFSATASNTAGDSLSSAPSGLVVPAGRPSRPLGVSGSGTGGSVSLSWNLPESDGGSALTDYIIEYSVLNSGTWTTFADGTSTTTSAVVTGLIAGSSYQFRVTAKNIIGSSMASLSSPTVATLPSSPTIVTLTVASEQVTVTWTAPSHLGSGTLTGNEYVVTAYDAQGNNAGSCSPTSGQTTCVVSGLDNGSPYTFKAMATTTIGDSVQSSATSSVIPVGVPSAPSDVIAVISGRNMTLTFTAPSYNGGSTITSYVITSSPVGANCTVGANATTYTCTGLTSGTNYTFTVKAVNNAGESSSSLASTGVTAVAPNLLINGLPSGIDIVGSVLTSVAIFEGAPEPVVTYQWQRCSSTTDMTTCASIGGATAATYRTVLADEGKFIRVVATATNGVSPNAVETSPISTEITGPPRATTPTTGITANIGEPYSLATVAFGGLAPIIYAITSGVLPAGLTFDTFTGNITGTPTTVGNATLVISATDQKNQSNSITFTITVVDPNAAAPEIPTAPAYTSIAGADAAARAAVEKAVAEAAAKLAKEKAAAEAAAKLAANKLAAGATAKAAADRAAAAEAAKLAEGKIAAAQAAQVAATKAAALAAAKIAAANAAQAAAKVASDKAAELAKAPTVSTASKQLAAAAAAAARIQAAAAVKNAAAAAASEVAAKNAVVTAAKEVTISIGSLNSATATAAKSATADIAAAAAKNAAELSAKAAAGEALAAKSAANAAARIAAEAVTRASAQQKAAAIAADLARKKAQELAKATAEKAAAEKEAQKATATLALVLEEQAKLSDQLASAQTAEERAIAQKLIIEVEKKVELAQEFVDAAIEDASTLTVVAAKSENSATQAAAAVQIKIEAARKANNIAQKANINSEKVTTLSIIAENAATSAKTVAKSIPKKAPKPVAPPVAVNAPRSDALINISGLKRGQKIRVSVKVNIK